MKLLMIRHGDPNYEIDSLTEKGWREAELLAERMEKTEVQEYFVSPLGRAKDTASCTLKRTGRTAVECAWLREFDAPIYRPHRPERLRRLPGTGCRETGQKRRSFFGMTDGLNLRLWKRER